jgi:hypothetical protein
VTASESTETRIASAQPAGRRVWPYGLAGAILAAVGLFVIYLHQSRTQAVDSDGAGNVLQAWDMLHGNPLLRGWWLSDVSFYTTELPQYVLIAWIHGRTPDVVHVGGAMTYVLLMIFAALVAKGDATGRAAVIRVLVPVCILLGPQLGVGTYVLLLNPAHVGTGVPVLLTWLVIDRLAPRWWVPVVVAILLTWGEIADPLVTYIAAAPLVAVSLFRLIPRRGGGRHERSAGSGLDPRWYDAALGAAALVSYGLSTLILHVLKSAGGFRAAAPHTDITTWSAFETNLRSTFEDVLLLFGADLYRVVPQTFWFKQPPNPHSPLDIAVTILHLLGLLVVVAAIGNTAWRFWRRSPRVEQLILAGILVDFVAFLLRARPDQNLTNSRQIVLVLPLGAILAGRFIARLHFTRKPAIAGLLAFVFAGYAVGVLYNLHGKTVPAQGAEVATWLEHHNLHHGLAGYWAANSITLDSGNRVHVRSISPAGNVFLPNKWESKSSWYDKNKNEATFVVIDKVNSSYEVYLTEQQATTLFGRPAETHNVGAYEILVYSQNLFSKEWP